MTLFFSDSLTDGVAHRTALRAMERAFDAEARGRTALPERLDVPTPKGFLRVMPGWLDDVMGFKVMTLVEGIGTRYLVLLYDVESGQLLALFDADELTRLRTGATTVLAAQALVRTPPSRLGMIGSGFEAVGQLRALASQWRLDEVLAFSPTAERCKAFAGAMSTELGISVRAVSSAEEAAEDQPVVLLATKSKVPVLSGARLASGCVVLSIGSTRPDLRELDRATFERAQIVVADDPVQLLTQSGDVIEAISTNAITPDRLRPLASVKNGIGRIDAASGRDLLVFKSLGTALQDLAIAREIYHQSKENGVGVPLGELSRLKPFAASKDNNGPVGAGRDQPVGADQDTSA